MKARTNEVVIVGGGLSGISAAIYLGRAKRGTLVIDEGKSMARWEPNVQNYLGFPAGIKGADLLKRGREQARRYHVSFARDRVKAATMRNGRFHLRGGRALYSCDRLLLTTGIFHIPPDIPGVRPCLGHSMFFCKDCDGHRVQGKAVAVYGWTNEAVEYVLGMLLYTSCVNIVTDGRKPVWDPRHARWVKEYDIPVCCQKIVHVRHQRQQIEAFEFNDGVEIEVDALFTTRGDIYHHDLARGLGAKVDASGEVIVDLDMRTSVNGLYAAGCVTPANCQMIIAAGQGATAAQAINRDLFEESLAGHSLRRFRARQISRERVWPKARRVRQVKS